MEFLSAGVARELAGQIADVLFINGAGEVAERLVLELPGKRDGGGWCRGAIIDQIADKLATNPIVGELQAFRILDAAGQIDRST